MDNIKKAEANEAMEAEINFGKTEFVVPGQKVAQADNQETEGGHQELTGEALGTSAGLESEKLASPGIGDDLMKSRITGLSVPEETEFREESYLIDVSQCVEGIDQPKMIALKMLTKDSGTKPLYVQTGANCFLVGKIDAFLAYDLLEKMMSALFGGEAKLYFQGNGEQGFRRVKTVKLSDIQLDL